MSVNREQWLFIAALAIAGLGIGLGGRGYSKVALPPGKALKAPPSTPLPEVTFIGKGEPRPESDGRDVFAPPRDWNPLPPLALDVPPLAEIGSVGPMPSPGTAAENARLFRRDPKPIVDSAAAAGDGGAAGTADSGNGDDPKVDTRSAGLNAALDKPADAAAKASGATSNLDDAAMLARFDWIKRKNSPRVFGYIKNADRFALIDDQKTAITFESIDRRTLKTIGHGPVAREELEGGGTFTVGFGIADTVRNRVKLAWRDMKPGPGNVRSQIDQGKKCLDWWNEDSEGALEGAEQFVKSALSFDPGNADAWELLAICRERDADTEGELKVYDDAKAAKVESSRLSTRRARVLRRIGLAGLAEITLNETVRNNPNDAYALDELGDLLIVAERGAEAMSVLDRAQKVQGVPPEMRLKLRVDAARAALVTGQIPEAEAQIDRAVKMGLPDAESHVVAGVVKLAKREFAAAQGEFQAALEIDPGRADAVFDLGVALLNAGQAGEARRRFAESADLDPFHVARATAAIGVVEEAVGNLEKASGLFADAQVQDPTDSYLRYRAGRAARRQGDGAGAIEQLLPALQEDGRIVDVLNELGFAKLLVDAPADAENYLRESLRREPGNPAVSVLLGSALIRQNKVQDAQVAFTAAITPPTGEPAAAALAGLGWCLYREGDVDGSLQRLGEARATAKEAGAAAIEQYSDRISKQIDDHRNKEQWTDRFDRAQLRNNWIITQSFGPTVGDKLENGRVHVSGVQRQTDPDELTTIEQNIEGASMVLVESDVSAGTGNEGDAGVRLQLEAAAGGQAAGPPRFEIAIARFADGTVHLYAQEQAGKTVVENWTKLDVAPIPAGETARFTIERLDYEKGTFAVKVNDRVVKGPIEFSTMRKSKKAFKGGPFARAGGRKNLDVWFGNARVVRTIR